VTCFDVLCPSRRTISHATLALADRCRPTRCAIRSQSVCKCRRCVMRFLPDSLTVASIPVLTLTLGSRLRGHMPGCRAASAQLHPPLAVRPHTIFHSGHLILHVAHPEFKATQPMSALSVGVRRVSARSSPDGRRRPPKRNRTFRQKRQLRRSPDRRLRAHRVSPWELPARSSQDWPRRLRREPAAHTVAPCPGITDPRTHPPSPLLRVPPFPPCDIRVL
jgi:hypothetical protein